MENTFLITSVAYHRHPDTQDIVAIKATIDGVEMSVPLDPANRHYDEIMKQVNAGTLTIEEAESE